MYQRDFSFKAESSKKGTTISVNTSTTPTPEHLNSVLDVILRSCLKNDDFIKLPTNNSVK